MPKKFILILAFLVFEICAHAQGYVIFETQNTSGYGSDARVYVYGATPDGSTNGAASGTNYYAQLFAADGFDQPESSLVAVGNVVNMRGGVNAGYVQVTGNYPAGPLAGQTVNSVVKVTNADGGPVTLQFRVWSAAAGINYDDAKSFGPLALGTLYEWGASNRINLLVHPLPYSPDPMPGLNGFVLNVYQIPEPSSFALGAVGLAALFSVRRKTH